MNDLVIGGVAVPRVWNASGARNFFGQGWRHHVGPLRPDFDGTMLVAKTTTMLPRAGNLPLRADLMPVERLPRCIAVDWRHSAVLNAVGLSGPGLDALLAAKRWQAKIRPFAVSIMAVGTSPNVREHEYRRMSDRLRGEQFLGPWLLEINLSCPNVGHDPAGLVADAMLAVRHFHWHPRLLFKINACLSPRIAAEVFGGLAACKGLVCSNTIPYGALPERIAWGSLFGGRSPLAELGGGGLSGAPLQGIVRDWIAAVRRHGYRGVVVGCGGILGPRDAVAVRDAGADAVALGAIAILRPWRVRATVQAVAAHHAVWP